MDGGSIPDYEAAMERIRAVTGCGAQTALAAVLGITRSFVSDARRRKVIPADWLLALLRSRGVNPDWILTGDGAQQLCPAEADPPVVQAVLVTKIRPAE